MILANFPSEILATYLVAQAFGSWPEAVNPTWRVGTNKLPDDTEAQIGLPYIVVFDRKADENSVNMQTGERGEFWGWQILVRGRTDELASPKIGAIAARFDAIYKVPLAISTHTYTIHRIRRTSQPTFLKQEERQNMRIWSMGGFVSIYEG